MQNLDLTAEELFNKIRGRFPSVTIGDAEGNVTNEPKLGRYFDFNFVSEGRPVGKVSISLDEKGVAVVYGEDLVANEGDSTKTGWYDFLKELRMFARKRTLAFDTRDITKSNLDSRDYKFLANNRGGDENMNESKMYGTSRVSYQDFDGARLMIKHTEGINQEIPGGRAKKVGSLYIESAEGERFKYPYKHLTGARAMARHVAEGGNAYDDFGKHIVSMSEEMSKLRKFKTYMGRSAVMAESLSEYMDVVKTRIATVKKTLESLQRPAYYKETFEAFAPAVMEDVPSDVAENWIDQLTIKQFNEELADVFPYIYKLVSEATKAEELTAEDLMSEKKSSPAGGPACWDGKKIGNPKTKMKGGKRVNNCVPEEAELEQGFNEMMGQFAEGEEEKTSEIEAWVKKYETKIGNNGDTLPEGYVKFLMDSGIFSDAYEQNETAKAEKMIGKPYADWDYDDQEKALEAMPITKAMFDDIEKITGTDGEEAAEMVANVMDNMDEGNAYAKAVQDAKRDGKKKGDEIDGPDGEKIKLEKEDEKTPLGEFILSYFDRETGQFPKGETAVLTMVEKDYGEQYITPAKKFIEMISDKVAEVMGYKEADMEEGLPDDGGAGVLEKLLQGITKDFVMGDDSAAQKMVDMLKKYNAPMDKVADMLEQKAKEFTKKTFSIFDNPLKKDTAGEAADRMLILADYIRSKAGQSEEFERMKELAGLR
jgi:hypothetical protein